MNPEITCVMTCYNHERWVGRTIQDILGQSFQDLMLLCVDDGSEDHTPEIIQSFVRQEPDRVLHLRVPHAGEAIAWQKGLDIVKSPFWCYLNSDCRYYPHYLATVHAEMLKPENADVAYLYGGFDYIDENEKVTRHYERGPFDQEDFRQGFTASNWGLARTAISHGGKMPRLQDVGYGPDWWYYWHLSFLGRFVNLPDQNFGAWRDWGNNLTRQWRRGEIRQEWQPENWIPKDLL